MSKARIFLVDDHPLVREWLGNLLRRQPDLEVCGEAGEPAEALELMAGAPPDVAVVDLSFERGSGLDLIRDLRVRFPDTRVLVLSMHEEAYYAERAIHAGARGYVAKREATSRVVEAINQVLAGRMFVSPELAEDLLARAAGRPPGEGPGSVEKLSDRELEVFDRLGRGGTTRGISEELNLSQKTVQEYCARIKEKLGLADNAELVREAVRWGERRPGRSGPP